MPDFADLKNGYEALWAKASLDAVRVDEARAVAEKIVANKAKYLPVQTQTGVPWYWQGPVHYRESTLDFKRTLKDGAPLNGADWEQSAIGTIRQLEVDRVKDWTAARCLYEFERWNGWGYFGRENSPYVWAGTNQSDETGKFVRDHVFDPDAPEKQLGCAAILKALIAIDPEVRAALVPAADFPPIAPASPASVDPVIADLVSRLKARTGARSLLLEF